jgi:dTDP-4-amino-4,6-dideoxygalactose transaminase
LAALAAEHGLRLAFDACHAIACTHGGQRIGGLGDAEVFSFHATKIINGAEGGCITTNDDALAARLRTIRSFHPGEEYANVPLRINGKMSEAQAALALIGLADVPRHAAANHARHEAYRAALAGLPGLQLMDYPAGEDNNFQYLVVDVKADTCGLTRDELLDLLTAENVICRRYFYPGAHRMPPFRNDPAHQHLNMPITDELCQRLLILPSGATVSHEDIARVGTLLRELIGLAPELRRIWGAVS